jgi:hypothetical protein
MAVVAIGVVAAGTEALGDIESSCSTAGSFEACGREERSGPKGVVQWEVHTGLAVEDH